MQKGLPIEEALFCIYPFFLDKILKDKCKREVIIFKILTHIAISLALCTVFKLPQTLPVITAVIAGAMIPDADNTVTYAGKFFRIKPLLVYNKLTHSFSGIVIFIALSFFFFKPIIASALIFSYCLHISADILSSEGCPLLFPFKGYNRSISLISFGRFEEFFCGIALFFIFLYYIT